MALEQISSNSAGTRYLNKMHDDNETLKGYLKEVIVTEGQFGDCYTLVMENDFNGEEFEVVTGGTAKYTAMNILAHQGKLAKNPDRAADEKRDASLVGYYIEISPDGSYNNKRGQKIKAYKVARDPDRKIGSKKKVKSEDMGEDLPF